MAEFQKQPQWSNLEILNWEPVAEYRFNGDWDRAIALVEKELIHAPQEGAWYLLLADLYFCAERWSAAEKALKAHFKYGSADEQSYYLAGLIASSEKHWEKAVKYFQKADKILPNQPEIIGALGWNYCQFDACKGLAILQRAAHLGPQNLQVLCDLAIAYLTQEQWQKAHQVLDQAYQISPQSPLVKSCWRAFRHWQRKKSHAPKNSKKSTRK